MTVWLWIGFLLLVLLLLALDLGVLNRHDHVIKTHEALAWTAVWICVSLLFNVAVYFIYDHHLLGIGTQAGAQASGREAAIEYFTGYIIEKSLSLDNIFVIALIFKFFRVPLQFQHRVLFWGIVGALVMRGAMIGAGVALIQKFTWAIYVFGGFLIFTAIKILVSPESGEPNLEKSRIVRLLRRYYPVSPDLDGHAFFTQLNGRRAITPLFLVLLLVETSDVLFAVDSIPAIFAVTQDPFIVFTSNIFAILGLRSLYFALAQLLHNFHYLQLSLVFILGYVGVKMILSHTVKIPSWITLAVIGGLLSLGIVASIIRTRRRKNAASSADPPQDDTEPSPPHP
jgi:tellurite resistance protein TerC